MYLKRRAVVVALALTAMGMPQQEAKAGDVLTNTNLSAAFDRNPARDGAIAIDGVHHNPAGVAFLKEGLHFSFSAQTVLQERTIDTSYGNLFQNNVNNPATDANGYKHHFKGNATAPIVPSLFLAYNKDKYSLQFSFTMVGGGGKCTFKNGLGSFEGIVASIPAALISGGVNDLLSTKGLSLTGGYGLDSYMKGKSFYYGFQIGGAYKVLDNLSVYGGLRVVYASNNYYGYVKNIQLQLQQQGVNMMMSAPDFFNTASTTCTEYAGMATQAAQLYAAAGDATTAAQYTAQAEKMQQTAQQMAGYGVATQDIELNCDQTGWGVAPIIGVDYKVGKLNLASKLEFKTRLRLKNRSANSASAAAISALEEYADGKTVAGDMPTLLTLGAQYEITPAVRVMCGYHHFFDVDTKQYTKSTMGDTNEYLLGAEWDVSKKVFISGGLQKTDYGMKPEAMTDISFYLDSWSFGLGFGVHVNDKMTLQAGYFQSMYDDVTTSSTVSGIAVTNDYTRKNYVIGAAIDYSF